MKYLAECKEGNYIIRKIMCWRRRLNNMGIREGMKLTIINNHGNSVIRVGDSEYAMSEGVAARIVVE